VKTLFPPSWLFVAALLFLAPPARAQNGLLREVFNDVSGGLDGLRGHPDFPGSPSLVDVIPEFETPGGIGDFYGQRVRGYLEAPQTGNYTFWIASDDQSELYLASDEQPQNASLIASVFNWTDSRQWDAEPNQRSQSIRLEQGRRYYIEALHVEGSGGDHLAVRWQLPDGIIEEPIPNNRLYVELIGPQISRQPGNVVVTEGQSATFAIEVSNLGPVSVQWLRNGAEIPGATNLTFFLPLVSMSDSGSQFQARLANRFAPGGLLSSAAFLTVNPDMTPPSLLAAHASGENDLVTLVFSEPVEAATALSLVNYSISGGIQVVGAAINGDGRTVILRTTPLTFGTSYEVFVEGLRDRANNANPMVESERAEFIYGFTPLEPEVVLGRNESPGPSTRRTALVISEIMYNPTPRGDDRNLEFIELYNSQESLQTISGYRLTGPIDYTFPEGTFIAARTNLVVAAVPADVQAVYGLPRVFGPFTNNLPDSGTLRLLNDQGAVLLEVPYSAAGDWPAAPDGGGPSLVLARASYGEADPRAWAASEFVGGTPGRAETATTSPYRGLVINEFLANSDPPAVDFIELYNYTSQEIDLSGVYLSDSPTTLKFQIPAGTTIGPLQFKVFTETELGFALSSGGERIYLRNPQNTRVIDAVSFQAQGTGVARGRFPDGSREFRGLSRATAGSANARPEAPQIVINEIMYNPVSGNQDEEYVELYNRSASPVNLRGWRLQDGISFTFTQDFIFAPGAYLAIAKDLLLLRTNHAGLNSVNSIGNFNGNLANDGERIALTRPEISIALEDNQLVTNVLAVVVDELTYGTGGRWPKWADGGGSSLELRDSSSDNDDAASWADSDESQKSSWVTLEYRGILDHGASNFPPTSTSRSLHVLMMDAGEALLDNVQVFRDGGRNLVSNPSFDSGFEGWLAGGTHEDSVIEPGTGPDRSPALHIRTTERGDTAANRIRVRLFEPLTNGTIATIRAQARWLRGSPEILLRLHGNYLELAGTMALPKNLGTPAAANSQRIANAGPSIAQARHLPALPVANQQVEVLAQIDDPDQIALAQLFYRVDPVTNYTRVPMTYRGAGHYSALIPGQPNLATVAFYIEALDSRGASSRFPALAEHEGVILFGDGKLPGRLSTYRLWLTQRNLDRWQRREQSSNKPLDATFVYNDERVIYNMGAHYSGSPFHWRGYSGPLGGSANYMMTFPDDDLFLGQTDFVLMLPSNLGSDSSGIREQVFYWMADQLNQPFNHRRYHHLFLNGRNRGLSGAGLQRVYEDTQQPNRDMIDQWFPDENEGELYKIEDWFEFSDSFSFVNRDATLLPFITTDLATGQPQLKRAPYRWMFRKRAVRDSAHDYSELLRLVAAANNPDPEEYVAQTRALVDIDEWMGAIALRHVVGDWDAFGYARGKNMYAYKPGNGKWRLMHWDIAFAFGLGDGTQTDLFATIEEVTARMMETPEFRRAYLRVLADAANGPMVASRVNAVIDAKFLGLAQNGIAASSPETVKQWIADRRSFVLQEVAGASASFAITSNNGNNFTTNRNTLVLRGNAPVHIKTLRVNGVEYPVRWTSLTGWELQLALDPQQNVLRIEGYDSNGRLVAQAVDTITVTVTGAGEIPAGRVVFNEIQYNPAVPGTEFVEFYNASATSAFDLSGYRMNGLGFTFPDGTVIAPGGFVLIAKDRVALGGLYGFTIPVAAQFDGILSNGGEALTLVAADGTNIVASLRYDNVPPWPVIADGTGASLQLIDARQDPTRAANWAAQPGVATPGTANSVRATLPAFPTLWLNEVSPQNVDGASDSAGDRDPWVEIYNSGSTSIALSGMSLTDDFAQPGKWTIPAGASIGAGERKVVWLDGEPGESTATEWHANFRPSAPTGSVALFAPIFNVPQVLDYLSYENLPVGLSYGAYPEGQAVWRETFLRATPGAPNDVTPPPARVFINEWMTSNSRTIQDPDDLDFDDWFELYNPGPVAVDLAGYSLTDDPANPDQTVIPEGIVIPPGGFLLVWADNENATNGQLHVSFRLSADGDQIVLYAPDGSLMDSVAFGSIARDVSGGRLTDGGSITNALSLATPGFSNSGASGGIAFTAVAVSNSQVVLTWQTGNAANFTVQYKNDLSEPAWTDLRTVVGSGGAASTTDTAGQRHRFYRILQQ
jgi:hypothetical protein